MFDVACSCCGCGVRGWVDAYSVGNLVLKATMLNPYLLCVFGVVRSCYGCGMCGWVDAYTAGDLIFKATTLTTYLLCEIGILVTVAVLSGWVGEAMYILCTHVHSCVVWLVGHIFSNRSCTQSNDIDYLHAV